MSFSDIILTILVLSGAAFIVWAFDLNPYSKNLQVYSQTCTNMILDNTYCKGEWQGNPVETYSISKDSQQITFELGKDLEQSVFKDCNIQDRKNWTCKIEETNNEITIKGGKVLYDEGSNVRQITRLEWLQNKVLQKIN